MSSLAFLEGILGTHTGRIGSHPIQYLHFPLAHFGDFLFLANLLPGAITFVQRDMSRLDTVRPKCVLETGSIGYIAHANNPPNIRGTSDLVDGMTIA